jgi:transcriptional regulator with XRE-family HTH domain
VTTSLGSELKSRREAAGLTQGDVARQLGVKRPTLSQWESGRHRPSAEHLTRLEEIYGARGALAEIVDETTPRKTMAELFADVADALLANIVSDDRRGPLGWSHNLPDQVATPLSTAYVIRTLQMVDDGRVDLHALAARLAERRTEFGWSNREGQDARPEVTAVVLGVMARLGHVADVEAGLAGLERTLDEFSLSRPYVVAVALECLLTIRPEAALADTLTQVLLRSRTPTRQGLLWTMDAHANPDIVQPSIAHTARATAVLRMVRSGVHRTEVDEAVDEAVTWLMDPGTTDDGITELIRPDPADRAFDVPINHFTSTWTIRALAGLDRATPARLRTSLDALWECYVPAQGLWAWRSDASLPSWMTHDAIAALRFLELHSTSIPVSSISS